MREAGNASVPPSEVRIVTRDPWQGKMERKIEICCADCSNSDEWGLEPVTLAMVRRYFQNQGWRKLRDGLWRCKRHVASGKEHLVAAGAVALALSPPLREDATARKTRRTGVPRNLTQPT